MIVDTSAVLAIFRSEPDRTDFAEAIASADQRLMSAGSYLELCMVAMSGLRLAETDHAGTGKETGHLITKSSFIGLFSPGIGPLQSLAMKKMWTLYCWLGTGKSRVMGQLTCTEAAVNKAIAELPAEHRENVYARPSTLGD